MGFAFFYLFPMATLLALPMLEAGLPRIRLLLGWIGVLMFVGGGVVVGYFCALVFALDQSGAQATIGWAVGVVVAAGLGAGGVTIGVTQRRAALRQLADLRR